MCSTETYVPHWPSHSTYTPIPQARLDYPCCAECLGGEVNTGNGPWPEVAFVTFAMGSETCVSQPNRSTSTLANLTIHAMSSISGATSTYTTAPSQRWHQARVLRHAAPGIPRHAHMSQQTILCKQGVGFSFMFVHTRCALQTLCMSSAKVHTHIGVTVKSIFALSRCRHVTVHILHYFTRHSPRRAQFKASCSTGGMHRFAITL